MRIEFDFLKFLPDTSSLYQWYMTNKHYFPEEGFRGDIYFAENDIKTQMSKLRNLTGSFNEKSDEYLVNFDPWYQPFEKYMMDNFVDSLEDLDNIDDEKFNEKLTQFLFSPSGGRYRRIVRWIILIQPSGWRYRRTNRSGLPGGGRLRPPLFYVFCVLDYVFELLIL